MLFTKSIGLYTIGVYGGTSIRRDDRENRQGEKED